MSGLYGLLFTKLQLPPASTINGRTILITGANTGLGREAARHALALGAGTVILGVRTMSKGEEAKTDIERSTGCSGENKVLVWPVDLESFDSVLAFADRARKHVRDGGRLDIAIMNAGFASQAWRVTGDGWERGLQANVLSTALLSLELLPLLLKSQGSWRGGGDFTPHLAIAASDIHRTVKFPERTADNILAALNDEATWEKSQSVGGVVERYSTTKLLDIFITMEMARLAPRDENGQPQVIVNCFTPGFCKSDLMTREKTPLVLKLIQMAVARTVEQGSKTLLHAATEGVETHGLWMENQAIADPGKIVTDPEMGVVRENVWREIVEVLRGVHSGLQTEY
ncbi:NAD(P)-binding protein [Aspergillus californicus]